MDVISSAYEVTVAAALAALDIPAEVVLQKRLPLQPEAQDLVPAETDANGRQYLLTPAAAEAWWSMKAAAAADGAVMELVSAFRGIAAQSAIIRAKQQQGTALATILTLSAAPGYSEHHTGRAIDINSPGFAATEEAFEHSAAFAWLQEHAGRFGFTLSYPRGNALGFIYEPWHWCYQPACQSNAAADADKIA